MRTLRESIFNDVEDIVNNDTILIEQFLKDNYIFQKSYTINKNNVVDVDGHVLVKNEGIKSLTNGLFRFGKVKGNFNCNDCDKLTSLEGAPEKVGGGFYCIQCKNLKSLKGAPKEVGGGFWCDNCPKLKSLEGAPDKVGTGIYCRECDSIKISDRDWKKYNINL